MKKHLMNFALTAAMVAAALPSSAQEHNRRGPISPHETIHATVDGDALKIVYGRPYTKKPGTTEVRKIWGGLVPYEKVWRTGADAATLFTTEQPLVIGGAEIPAGTYSLYTLPMENGTAKLIINKQTGQWGTIYKEDQDLVRVDLTKQSLDQPVNQFTMAIDSNPSGGGVLKLMWEKTQYSAPFTVKK